MSVGPARQAGSVPELAFAIDGVERVEHAAVPTLRFDLRVQSQDGRRIRSVLLDVQVQIAARRRPYGPEAHERLFELFGPVADWATTLRTLPWVRTTLVVPGFTGSMRARLDVPCSYDLEVAASRYFAALDEGEVPLEFLFSGTVFYGEPMQAARISPEREAVFQLPVWLWKETMERYFRGTTWLRLSQGSFDRLAAYRARHALGSWDDAIDALLQADE